MKIKVIKKIKKNGQGTVTALIGDLGYRLVYLSFDENLCAELLNVTRPQLEAMEMGVYEVCCG